MWTLVQVVARSSQRVDVPLERRLVDPTLRRTKERHPTVVVLDPWMVLVEVVVEDLTHILLEVDLSFTTVTILEAGSGLRPFANGEVLLVAVVVFDVQSAYRSRPDSCVPDQVEHRVATGCVVELLAVFQDGISSIEGQLVRPHVLHMADGGERELLVDAVRSGVDPLTEGEELMDGSELVLQRDVVHVL